MSDGVVVAVAFDAAREVSDDYLVPSDSPSGSK